ncbi:hypothetical protein TNCV_3955541 [Trichonephila clavipes]|nr:hypothetical protein TNCV_3955541 [Trichonephila clavipes]
MCLEFGQIVMAPSLRRPGCVFGCYGQIGLGGYEREKKPCPGSIELEETAKQRDFVRDWSEKEGKTMNTGGVEE